MRSGGGGSMGFFAARAYRVRALSLSVCGLQFSGLCFAIKLVRRSFSKVKLSAPVIYKRLCLTRSSNILYGNLLVVIKFNS